MTGVQTCALPISFIKKGFSASDFNLGAELNNPVRRDFELVRRSQSVALQQKIKLAAQAQVPWPLADDQRLMRHKEGGLHHPAAQAFQPTAVENFFDIRRFPPAVAGYYAPERRRNLLNLYATNVMQDRKSVV